MPFKKKQQVSQCFEELKSFLEREVELNQNILDQLDQKEYILLIGEIGREQEINLEVALLSKDQTFLSEKKQIIEEKIKTLCQVNEVTACLDPLEEKEAEIVILIEKERLLKDKIYERQKHIKSLTSLIKGEKFDLRELNMQVKILEKNKKPLLITLDIPNDEKTQESP